MLTLPLKSIITLKTLKKAYAEVSKASVGLDAVSVELFEEDLRASLQEIVDEVHQGRYAPEPMSRIYLLSAVIDPKVDSLRIYTICATCMQSASVLGKEPDAFDVDGVYFF